ncbi:hypothetical protein PDESU_03331 [Pontiella desulfatans]|uniref:DNA primase n=1 Tax=Pontiella desulfatans TaxID=2750659 RepID=A0A6C2U407_PONDE|nr:AAA family ATPase [Pontiella desulfatans]VGO14762.1 hypothetical protein PDESU_03331 [Pontiella desulfatans]
MTAYDVIERKLRDGMVQGQMHGCLRDVGRLAGGYASTGAIQPMDLFQLEQLAASLSMNAKEGTDKWCEAVKFGRGQPIDWEEPQEYQRRESKELEWDSEIGGRHDTLKVVDSNWIQDEEIHEPNDWQPVNELIRYLSALFQSDDHVGYVTECWEKDGKHLPKKGCFDRTAGELIDQLQKCKGDIGAVIGDTLPEVGAWIRFNPFDGVGIKDENVSELRYALVESDTVEIPRQIALLKELELPIVTMVHSGGKSVHAVVRIEADSMDVYRKRVDFLYEVCKKNGLEIDRQNRNPSRLSRMPGILRNGKKQFLVGTNIGKLSWAEWEDWIQDLNDDLPDPEALDSVFDNLPDKSPELIAGVLRQGHKMRIAGPSKAGKSFKLNHLCIAIAEGWDWLGWQCAQGPVLYVNLELDRASCLHRFRDIYRALGREPKNVRNIDIWNLRGKAVPMDKLAPKLIRRSLKKGYKAIVIDPIYKVITGDENSAEAMSHFCNQFDKICAELGAAVIDCHHHSKGGQGAKRSADRASGSGVFARDPDALLDLIELEAEEPKKVRENRAVCEAISSYLDKHAPGWQDEIADDDAMVEKKFEPKAKKLLSHDQGEELNHIMMATRMPIRQATAWRIEATLREFAPFKPRNLWFQYPVHITEANLLNEASPAGDEAPWQKKQGVKKMSKTERVIERKNGFVQALEACSMDGPPTVTNMMEYMGLSKRTIMGRLKECGYAAPSGQIVKKEDI